VYIMCTKNQVAGIKAALVIRLRAQIRSTQDIDKRTFGISNSNSF